VFADPDGLGLELVIDDGEDEPLIAVAADVDAHLAIRGIHALRAYRAEAASASPVVRGDLRMEPAGEGKWLARGERRHSLVDLRGRTERPRDHGRGHDAPRRVHDP
jgi:glyoxalase family protein